MERVHSTGGRCPGVGDLSLPARVARSHSRCSRLRGVTLYHQRSLAEEPVVLEAGAVEHAVAALGRWSTSRNRAALEMNRRPPRGPGSATIDHHLRPSPLNGKAFHSD